MIEYTLLKQLITTAPEMAVGNTLRFDHIGCPAGEDTRGRLYVKRTSDNFWVAYCHNCGSPGWYKHSPLFGLAGNSDTLVHQLKKLLDKDELPPVQEHETEEPEESVYLGSMVCIAACDDWMLQRLRGAGFEDLQIDSTIVWYVDCNKGTLVTPLWWGNRVIGKQERLPPGFKPKTITTYTTGSPKVGYDAMQDCSYLFGKDVMVITEDPLSALCVHHASTRATGYALLGTHLSDVKRQHIVELVEGREVKEVVVWLDPDEAGRRGTWDVVEGLRHVIPNHVGIKVIPQTLPEASKVGDLHHVAAIIDDILFVKKGK